MTPTRHDIHVAAAGRQLAATVVEPAGDVAPRARALVLHGWTGSRSGSSGTVAAVLASIGCTSLVPDLPGHGDSPGDRDGCTRAEFLRAAEACHDQLAASGPDTPVLVVGTSFGGYLAAQLLDTRRVDALVLRVPADYPDPGFDDQPMGELFDATDQTLLHAWRSARRDPGGTRALRALAHARHDMPMLVQQSELDDVVPAELVDAFVHAHPEPRLVTHELLAGAPHALSHAPEQLARANASLAAWVDRALG